MGRPQSANPSKAALRMRRLRERDNNPIDRGGPLTPCAASISGVTFGVLIAKRLISPSQAEDTSPEGKKALAQALSNYVYLVSIRDAEKMGL